MKKIILTIISALIISVAAVNAQEPTPQLDTVSTPVKEGDPEVKTPPPNVNYLHGMTRITSAEIPAAIKQTLESGSQYAGWERASVYKNKSGKTYVIEIKEADRTRIFRFDKNGKPILD